MAIFVHKLPHGKNAIHFLTLGISQFTVDDTGDVYHHNDKDDDGYNFNNALIAMMMRM